MDWYQVFVIADQVAEAFVALVGISLVVLIGWMIAEAVGTTHRSRWE